MSPSTTTYHHGDLRTALLHEAAALITEHGAEGVTMRALGERLGVSRAAPYRHFKDKAELLVAVAASGFQRLGERLAAIDAGAPGSSVTRVRKLGEAYIRFAVENPAHYRVMYGRESLSRQDLPELREAANALFEHLVTVFETHQASGALKRQDPRGQAYVAWSAVHGMASLLIDGQITATDDIDGLIRQTTRTLLDGMSPS